MPTLNYNPVPTVAPDPAAGGGFQQQRASPQAFGALEGAALEQLGQRFEQAGDVAAKATLERQTLFNQVAADEAGNALRDTWNKRLYGDPNNPGDTGFYGKHGKDAMTEYPLVRKDLDQMLRDQRSVLQNDSQRHLFDSAIRREHSFLMNETGRHYDRQFNTYTENVATAKQKIAQQDMSAAAIQNDDARLKEALGKSILAAEEKVRAKGGSAEELIVARQTEAALFVKLKAEALAANGDAEGALRFVRNNLEHVNKDEGPDLINRLKARADAQILERAASGEKVGAGTGGGLIRGGALEKLTPYATGNAVPGGRSPITGIDSTFGDRLATMVDAMPDHIRAKFAIVSGFRDQARQAEVNPDVKNSHHTQRTAVDTTNDPDVINWINQNGKLFGVGYTIKHLTNEQNHLEMLADDGNRMQYNYGGIRKAGPARTPSEGGFQSYKTPEEGVQAIKTNLEKYYAGGVKTAQNPTGAPLRTVSSIVTQWAPPDENDTGLLIRQAVGEVYGVDAAHAPQDEINRLAVQPIDLKNPTTMSKMITATIKNENGNRLPVNPGVISKVAGGPDTLIKPMPPRDDPAFPPDEQVPGLLERWATASKNIPADRPDLLPLLAKKLRTEMNAAYADQQHARRQQAQAQQDMDNDISNKLEARMTSNSPNFPTTDEVRANPDMSAHAKETMIGAILRAAKGETDSATSARNSRDLYARIWAEDTEPEKIWGQPVIRQAYVDGRINSTDRDRLLKEFDPAQDATGKGFKKRTEDLLKRVDVKLMPSLAFMPQNEADTFDPTGAARMNQWRDDVMTEVNAYRDANKNPAILFQPGTKEKPNPLYVGGPEFLSKYPPPAGPPKVDPNRPALVDPSKLNTQTELQNAYAKKQITREQAMARAIELGIADPPRTPAPADTRQVPMAR